MNYLFSLILNWGQEGFFQNVFQVCTFLTKCQNFFVIRFQFLPFGLGFPQNTGHQLWFTLQVFEKDFVDKMSKFWVMIVQNLIQGNELLFSLETLVLRLSHVSQLLTFFHIETITFSSFQSVLDLHYLVFSVLFVFQIILCLYASFLWCCCHRFWLVFLSNLRGFGQHFEIPLFGHQVGLI